MKTLFKKNLRSTSQKLTSGLGILSVGLMLGLSIKFAQAWTNPTAPPPSGNVGGPLNVSGNAQTKSGNLGIGAGANPNYRLHVFDQTPGRWAAVIDGGDYGLYTRNTAGYVTQLVNGMYGIISNGTIQSDNRGQARWAGLFYGDYGVHTENTAGYYAQLANGSYGLLTNGIIKAPQMCLGSDCRTAWPTSTASQWVTSGSNIYYNQGNIGVGTQTDAAHLQSGITVQVQGNNAWAGEFIGDYGVYTKNTAGYVTQLANGGYGLLTSGKVSANNTGGNTWAGEFRGDYGLYVANAAGYSSQLANGSYGLLTNGTIQAGSEIVGTLQSGFGQFRAVSGNYGVMLRNDGTNSYFLLTASGNAYGSWNGLRPLTINNATGNVSFAGDQVVIEHAGDVGIGVANPLYKLHVVNQVANEWGAVIQGGSFGLHADNTAGYYAQLANGSYGLLTNGTVAAPNFIVNGTTELYTSGGNYGGLQVSGSKNGWSGIGFKDVSGNWAGTLMMNTTTSGFFNAADNAWRWSVDNAGNSTQPGSIRAASVHTSGNINADASIGAGASLYAQSFIDTNNTGYYVDPNGTSLVNQLYANNFYYNSDAALKENIETIPHALNDVLRLRGVSFDWKSTKDPSLGVVAQEVEQVYPALVNTDKKTGLKAVQYGNLVGPIIEAIKELNQKITALMTTSSTLEQKVADQEVQIETQAKAIDELRGEIQSLKGN